MAASAGAALLAIDAEGKLPEGGWEQLAAAKMIVFGSPTYMGGASWQFKEVRRCLVQALVHPAQTWKDKLAAGFTNSATMNGDKLSTLHYFFHALAAVRHAVGRHRLMPSNSKAATRNDVNYVGSFSGLMTVSPSDASPDDSAGRHRHRQAFGTRSDVAAKVFG